MKFSLSLALLATFFVSSCSNEEPPPGARYHAANNPAVHEQQYPPSQQPFNPNAGPAPTPIEHPEENAEAAAQASPPPSASPTKAVKGDYPYAMPVPGKPGIVYSPYVPDKQVDVRGMPPGSEVKDPYTDYKKIFLVP